MPTSCFERELSRFFDPAFRRSLLGRAGDAA
jgi:hypothetical protein